MTAQVAAVASTTPAWAGVFIGWIAPSSLVCAVAFPLVRLFVLKWNSLSTSTGMWIESGASGLSFPSFVALSVSLVEPTVRTHLEGHVLALAGGIGVIYTIASLFRVEREESRNSWYH
jgi:hypothetical protein